VCENKSEELGGLIIMQHQGKLNMCMVTQLNYITSKVYYIDVKELRLRASGTYLTLNGMPGRFLAIRGSQ